MKYDGTGWCKQTAAIEESRHRSGSFTHWCAWRPGTKSLLMKVPAEAQGVRGLGMVSISSANQTAPHRATPCHTAPHHATPCHTMPRGTEPGLRSQGLCSLLTVVFHRCLFFLPVLINHTESCARMDLLLLQIGLLVHFVRLGQALWS